MRRTATALAALALAVVLAPACRGSDEPRPTSVVPAPATTGARTVLAVLGGDETRDPPSVGSLTRAWDQQVLTSLPASSVLLDLADRRPTARSVVRDQLPRAQGAGPTVATVWLGEADAEEGTDDDTFAGLLTEVVTGLQQAGARTVLLLRTEGAPTGSGRYAAAIDGVAEHTGARVVVLPAGSLTQDAVAAAVRPLVAP